MANQIFQTAYKQRESYGKRASEFTEVEVMAWKEIPCEYRFEGNSLSITWLENKLIEEEFLAEE